jgi:AbiA family abortive infection protein
MSSSDQKLSSFLSYQYWRQAIRLLERQVELCSEGENYFRTLSLKYYESNEYGNVQDKRYFKQIVDTQLFYALRKHYYSEEYFVPRKGSVDVRPYLFMSYLARAVHYSIGLYLMSLTKNYRGNYYGKIGDIESYWGSGISVDGKGEINNLSYETLYFWQSYRDYTEEAKNLINNEGDKYSILHYDIKNFFEEVSVEEVMNKTSNCIKEERKREFNFDSQSINNIIDFYRYLMSQERGIPQTDVNIMSTFIGHLYMTYVDMAVHDIVRDSDRIDGHQMVRYVDDTYMRLSFNSEISSSKKDKISKDIIVRISEKIADEFGLHVNAKSKLYRPGVESERESFMSDLVKPSTMGEGGPLAHVAVNDQSVEVQAFDYLSEFPESTVSEVLSVLEKLPRDDEKEARYSEEFGILTDSQKRVLKYVHNPKVRELMQKEENKKRAKTVLESVDLDIIYEIWRPIISLLDLFPDLRERFEEHFTAKKTLTLEDKWICLNYILTYGMNEDIRERLVSAEGFGRVLKYVDKNEHNKEYPGYFRLHIKDVLNIKSDYSTVRQIKHRKINEKEERTSISLNHLLNEIHSIVFNVDEDHEEISKYDVKDVKKYLKENKVPHFRILQISDLFSIRNNNPISHPGMDKSPSKFVSNEKYKSLRGVVGDTIHDVLCSR